SSTRSPSPASTPSYGTKADDFLALNEKPRRTGGGRGKWSDRGTDVEAPTPICKLARRLGLKARPYGAAGLVCPLRGCKGCNRGAAPRRIFALIRCRLCQPDGDGERPKQR